LNVLNVSKHSHSIAYQPWEKILLETDEINSSGSALVYGAVPFSYCDEDRGTPRINESR
jgi:hypothetical protein